MNYSTLPSNAATYRQLQCWLKEQQSYGWNIDVKLNSSKATLQSAANSLSERQLALASKKDGHALRYTHTLCQQHLAKPYTAKQVDKPDVKRDDLCDEARIQNFSYRELQQWLKRHRANGHNIPCKLNAKKDLLRMAAIELLSSLNAANNDG